MTAADRRAGPQGGPVGEVGRGPAGIPETEEQFLGWVKDAAHAFRWQVYHTRDSRGSDPGFPDLVLVRQPRIIFAELKSAGGRMSAHQKLWLAALLGCPVEVYLWRPADRPDIEMILRDDRRTER